MLIKPFTKANKRALCSRLELFYALTLQEWKMSKDRYNSDPKSKITKINLIDRRFRTRLKALEVILHLLGSQLFENGEKPPSIRKTRDVRIRHLPTKISKR